MKKLFLIFTIALTFLSTPSRIYVCAEDTPKEEMKLYLGETKIIPVNVPSRIVISNPSIADVTNVSESEITLTPKAVGTTTFVFWDNLGEQSYRVIVAAENMNGVKQRVDGLIKDLKLPAVYTAAKDQEGKVLILGEVKTQDDKDRIDLALGQLKDKTINLVFIKEEVIVDIDVQVLELDKDATKTLGFIMPSSIEVAEPSYRFSKNLRGSLNAIFHVFEWPRSDFAATLDLLVEEGKARILSQPRLACLSGKEAELLVGGEKPIMTTQIALAGSTTTVEYKEYGIKLKIKPTVVDNEKIQLSLKIEVSELGTAETLGSTSTTLTSNTTTTTARAYPLTKRNATTELFLNDGQTLAIGGLMKQKKEEDISKTAFFGDIPIIGAFFRHKTTRAGGGGGERGDVELFITLTPTIVAGKEIAKGPSTPQTRGGGLTVETKPLATEESILPEIKDYMKSVQLKIINAVYYPQEAKDYGWEGTVNLILRITAEGNLKDVKILQSSGFKLLDDTAIETVKKQAPYPPFPPEVRFEELKVQVPIVYSKR